MVEHVIASRRRLAMMIVQLFSAARLFSLYREFIHGYGMRIVCYIHHLMSPISQLMWVLLAAMG